MLAGGLHHIAGVHMPIDRMLRIEALPLEFGIEQFGPG